MIVSSVFNLDEAMRRLVFSLILCSCVSPTLLGEEGPSGSVRALRADLIDRDSQVAEADSLVEPSETPVPPNLSRQAALAATRKQMIARRAQLRTDQISQLHKPITAITLTAPPQTSSESDSVGDEYGEDASQVSRSRFPALSITSSPAGVFRDTHRPTFYCRNPLYFEDSCLERHGRPGVGRAGLLTNPQSAAKFLLDTALLPIRSIAYPPNTPVRSQAK